FMATLLYLFNGLEIYRRQREVQKQLDQARKDADSRLMELEYLSQFDPLTSLPNRTSFESRLNVLLGRATRRSAHFGVALIDLDHFKPINDSFGHHVGDAVLAEVAARLKRFSRHSSDVARLGGDEFAMILIDAHSKEKAQELGDQLSDLLAMPILYDELAINIGASVGISLTRTEGRNRSVLMKRADLAMYDAKRNGEPSAVVYDEKTITGIADLTQKPIFEHAIANKEILPYYQPKVDLLTGKILGLEALARWEKANGEVLLPAEFIPQIDDLGLMHDFTYSITRQVINDIGRWKDMGFDSIPVSTNVGERMLATPIGLQDLLWMVSESKLPPDILTFEVTEDVVLGRAGDFIRNAISTLSKEGVRISLDDFGTGFASFRHLEELHLDELKIDTSFVTKIGQKPSAMVIIEGFLGIAAGLGIEVVAEGVETEDQRDFLLKRGCRVGQGFLFSKAVSFIDVTKLLIAEERKMVI
ncbi:MAG: EAL domain-containing protein, partial [Pseudomonadota bacterium]